MQIHHGLAFTLPLISTPHNLPLWLQEAAELVIFSPHLDDSVLSCGALLAWTVSQGKKVTVINIFTEGSPLISPLTEKLLKQAGFPDAKTYFEKRYEEDQKALDKLGISRRVNVGLIDAAWRISQKDSTAHYPTTTLNQDLNMEKETYENLKAQLAIFNSQFQNSIIIAPLGVGAHTDHILMRNAVSELFKNVIYYVDFPYSDKYPKDEKFITKNNLLPFTWNQPFYEQKAKAIEEYTSQFNGLFPDHKVTLQLEVYYC